MAEMTEQEAREIEDSVQQAYGRDYEQYVGRCLQERLRELVLAKIGKASDMVAALCKPRGSEGSREWIMSIPARRDHDPDLVIGDALQAARDFIEAYHAAEDGAA